jgi:hypothetical protein
VQQGTVIRRKRRDVERRGFRVAENGGQLLIFCNRAPLRWQSRAAPDVFKRHRAEIF